MKLAILGAESLHAADFAALLAGKDGRKLFADVELVGIYADKDLADSEAGIKIIREKSSCKYFTNDYKDFLSKVDGVIITSRHGSKHLAYARPYLERGIPVWVDKPICSDVQEIIELTELARKNNTSVIGGSSLAVSKEITDLSAYIKENRSAVQGGHITAPIHMNSEYDGFWFYAPHAVQMMTEVFGTKIRRVRAHRGMNYVQAIYEYDDFPVSVYFGTGYTVTLYKDNYSAEPMKVSPGSNEQLLEEFYNLVKKGTVIEDYKEFIAPVRLIDATIKAYEQEIVVEL